LTPHLGQAFRRSSRLFVAPTTPESRQCFLGFAARALPCRSASRAHGTLPYPAGAREKAKQNKAGRASGVGGRGAGPPGSRI